MVTCLWVTCLYPTSLRRRWALHLGGVPDGLAEQLRPSKAVGVEQRRLQPTYARHARWLTRRSVRMTWASGFAWAKIRRQGYDCCLNHFNVERGPCTGVRLSAFTS